MTKSLLISIQPQHLLKVLNGDKTYEVRKVVPKWVLEALERGETVEAYLYCTKGGQALSSRFKTVENGSELYYTLFHDRRLPYMKILNGTIPVKVVIDGYEKIDNEPYHHDWLKFGKQACLNEEQWYQYFTWSKTGGGYALHISKVEILDEVMKLWDFHIGDNCITDPKEYHMSNDYGSITRPPQNMMIVWVK
jgi:hypothetical protein